MAGVKLSMRILAVVVLVEMAGAILAPVLAQAASPPLSTPLQLSACQVGESRVAARCGLLTVPEDRSKRAGRRLSLKVIVLPSLTPNPAEPVFLLPGGPGQAATDAAGNPGWDFARQGHDLVMMDFRGTGDGPRLDCRFEGGSAQTDLAPVFELPRSFWRDCATRLSRTADLRFYTTPAALQDMDDLRQRLGADRIDIVGASYGTREAMAYVHAYPGRVRAALLTGVLPMGNRTPLYVASSVQRALDLTVAECARQSPCHAAFPDPIGDLRAVLDTLRVKPAKVTVHDAASGATTLLTFDSAAFVEGVKSQLYDMDTARRLPLLLRKARGGDYGPFAESALDSGRGARRSLRFGLLLSVTCPEDVSRIRPDEIVSATAGSFMGDQRVRGQIRACGAWPKAHLPRSYYTPFSSEVPVLLVSGVHDPMTPPQWGEAALKSFPHGVHLITLGAHADIDACVEHLATALFQSGAIESRDVRCPGDADIPPFSLQ